MSKQALKPSDGFFIAKRQMQETLDYKLCELKQKANTLRKESDYTGLTIVLIEIEQIENIRDYVRNGMLWDTALGE